MTENYKSWKYPDYKRGKNYAMIQYSLGNPKKSNTNITWSQPIKVGSKKFKNLLLFGKINIDDFPQYKISNGGRYGSYVYYDQNGIRSQGKEITNNITKSTSPDKFISFDLTFYAPISELSKLQKGHKKLDLYSHAMKDIRWNGKHEKAYPLFHRKFKFVMKTIQLSNFVKKYKNPWELRNGNAYNYFWDTFVKQNDILSSVAIDRQAIDSISDIALGYFDNIKDITDNERKRLNYRSAVAMDDFFMNCGNFLEYMEEEEDYFLPKYPKDTTSFIPKNGCLYYELMKIYKPIMDKAFLRNPRSTKYMGFCYAKIWEIIHGKNVPLPDDDDANAWGLSWEQVIKFFDYYDLEASLYSAYDGKVKEHFKPKKINTFINNSHTHFRYIWSNDHCWTIDKHGEQSWSQKLKHEKINYDDLDDIEKEYELENQPVYYNFNFNNDKTNYLLINNIDEIYSFLEFNEEEPTDYCIITNLDIEDVFLQLFYEYKILSKLLMRGNTIDNIRIEQYRNKNVIIRQSFSPATSQVIIDNIDDYILMNDYISKAKKILLHPHNSSMYSPQVFNVFQTFKKGGLFCQFDTNFNNDLILDDGTYTSFCGMSDFNRFYISELLSIKYFPVFNFDCYFQNYNDEPIEDLNLYYIKKTNNTFEYPFYKDDLCFGINLKKSSGNFKIIKFMRPSTYHENNLKELFCEIYASSLPDNLKKNIGNILCGLLQQKNQKLSKSFFSKNIQEVNYIADKLDRSSIIPLQYKNNEGYIVTKEFSRPLMNGFYPIGLLLLDGTQLKMDQLRIRLDECGLNPYAIKTDCIYHDINTQKYNDFMKKYPDYFDYQDQNDFNALGKIKYETKECGIFNKHCFKPFQFDFSTPQVNTIDIQDEFNIDEFCNVIEKHQSLFLFGHGGYGKSTSIIRACEKMKKKIIILTKTHPLCDKYYDEKKQNDYIYECYTAEKFFKLNPFSDIPFGWNNYNTLLHDVYAVLLDDALLCNLKIFNQWIFLRRWVRHNKPQLKLIGNGDPLQLDMMFNDENNSFKNFDGNKYDKMIGMMSRLFENVITLQYNKRLRSVEDRNINNQFIQICKTGDFDKYMDFASKYMNIVKSIYDIPLNIRKNIKNVIVARNKDRNVFNKSCFAWEHGNYQEQFQVGHIVMSNKSIHQLKFSSFQLFSIVSKSSTHIKLKNILREEHTLNLDIETFKKYFSLPYSRTAHSWQGMSCSGVLVVYGFHHLYNDMSWFYTADSRITEFKNIYHIIDDKKMEQSFILKDKIQDRIDGYFKQDLNAGRKIDKSRFIDVAWIECELRRLQYQCSYCKSPIFDDWSVDRLNSSLPHYKSNSTIACISCNCAKGNRV